MIKDFFEWFNSWEENKKFSQLDLSADGVFARGIESVSKGLVGVGDGNYYIKTPHSRAFKFGYVNLKFEAEDNLLATTSELLAQKKYKEFKFLYANHRPIFKPRTHLSEFDYERLWKNRHVYNYEDIYRKGIYTLVSPALTSELIDTISMGDITSIGMRLARKNSKEQRMFDNFESVLDSKKYYLKFMTSHCYDQYVKFVLASIFEFSDDDHYDNVWLCKNHQSDKYEDLFLFDKESTSFNPFVAINMQLEAVKFRAQNHTSFNGMPVSRMGERGVDRMFEVTRLIRIGKLEKKYIEFLNQIAGIDFEKIAAEIEMETGIKVNQKQLDVYKYGADFAGIVAQKEI